MRNPLIWIIIFSLWGCGSLTDRTEEFTKTETVDHKLQTSDKGNNSYSGDPLEPIHVSASGNAKVDIQVGEKGRVEKQENRDTSAEEEVESSLSLDAMVSQVSLAGWALLLICISILLAIVWWFIKTTAIGKATDTLLADSIDTVNGKLSKSTPGTELHTELMTELANLRMRQRRK